MLDWKGLAEGVKAPIEDELRRSKQPAKTRALEADDKTTHNAASCMTARFACKLHAPFVPVQREADFPEPSLRPHQLPARSLRLPARPIQQLQQPFLP